MDKYKEFIHEISRVVPQERIYTDALRCLAWGTDAGFYRLLPKVVVRVANETEVTAVLAKATSMGLPVTFRAAGTSLSGQAISDSYSHSGRHFGITTVSLTQKPKP